MNERHGEEVWQLGRDKNTGTMPVQDGSGLVSLMADIFPMTAEEADVLLGYVEGHGYALAGKDGRLYRGDICGQPEKTSWEEYDIEDLVDDANEWNFEMMQDSERLMDELESYDDYQLVSESYEAMRRDEKILDGLFDRTKYGKELEDMAVCIADGIISSLSAGKDIDSAIGQLKEGIAGMRENSAEKEKGTQKGRKR